jgi:DNA polymerase-3 subunit chi
MTQIDFYTHVEDKLDVACRLTSKAFRQGLKVLVRCPDAGMADTFGKRLWCVPATAFVPHCSPQDSLAAETPVHVDATGAEPQHEQILVNLCTDWPPYFSRFERVIEIVSRADDDSAAARARWKFYKERGYAMKARVQGKDFD